MRRHIVHLYKKNRSRVLVYELGGFLINSMKHDSVYSYL